MLKIIDFIENKFSEYFKIPLTKNEIKYLYYGISWMGISKVVSLFTSLIITVLFARYAAQEIYGEYSLYISIIGILSIFSLPGMEESLTISIAKGYDGTFMNMLKIKTKYSILGIIASILICIYFLFKGDDIKGAIFIVIAIFFIPLQVFPMYNSIFWGKKYFNKSSKCFIILRVGTLSGIGASLFLFPHSIFIIILTYIFINSILNSIFLYDSIKFRENNNTDKKAYNFSIHLTLMTIISILFTYSDKLVLSLYLDYSAIAIYTIALGFHNHMKALLILISSTIYPKLAEQASLEVAWIKVKNKLCFLFLSMIFIAIVSYFIIPEILTFLYTKKYEESIRYAQLLVIAQSLGCVGVILRSLLKAHRKVIEMYIFDISFSILNIILWIFLVKLYGIYGIVISRFIAVIFANILAFFLVIYALKKKTAP